MTDRIIRFGLDAVAAVGEDVARSIAAEAPYESLADFLTRCPAAGKQAVIALIAAGAFDGLHGQDYRAALVAALPACMLVTAASRQLRAIGQADSLAGFHVDLSGPQWSPLERLAAEHAVLGLYVSGHPVDLYETMDYLSVSALGPQPDGRREALAGLVGSIDRKVSRKGDPYAVMTLEDADASIEVLWFERFLGELTGIKAGEIVGVTGRVSARDDWTSLIGYEVERLPLTGPAPAIVRADAAAFDSEAVQCELDNLNGDRPVHLVLAVGNDVITFQVRS